MVSPSASPKEGITVKPEAEPPAQDVEMPDAAGEEVVDPQVLKHQKREALLAQILSQEDEDEPYAHIHDWKVLTAEALQKIKDGQIEDVLLRLNMEPDTHALFYEMFLCVKYCPERVEKSIFFQLISPVLESDAEAPKITLVAVLSTFHIDDRLVLFVRELQQEFHGITPLHIGKYMFQEAGFKKFDIVREYERKKVAMKKDMLEQSRYNLFLECPEGYAKLMVIVHDCMTSPNWDLEVGYAARATETLIGHFNLDPFRCLLALVGLFVSELKHYKFAIAYIKASSWWTNSEKASTKSLEDLSMGGSEDLALALGWKLQNVTSDYAGLITFVSIAIKEGLVSFASIYKFLPPDDKEMEILCERIVEKVDEEIFKASASALALSGPLADEDEEGNPTKASSEQKEEKKDPLDVLNLKVQLFKQFLQDGLYYPTLYLLGRYPKLAFASKETLPLCLRMVDHMLEPLKAQLNPLNSDDVSLLTQTRTNAKVQPYRKQIWDGCASKGEGFFFAEWSEGLPLVNNVDDFIKFSNEFLSFFGAKIGEDPLLVSVLSKIALHDLKASEGTPSYEEKLSQWFDYTRKFILPASTFIQENPVAAHDMFSLLKCFPLDWRFNLYGEFQLVTSKNNEYVRLNYSKAEKSTKDILKRLTKENVKPTMRRLSKITFANPLPAFNAIISQVESYDNLTNLVVEAARYFTDYAWDVLVFVLLNRLTLRRESIQADGINDATWLQSLSTFIAKLAKNYSAFDITPILTYCLKSLHKGNSVGLTIFRELIGQMGGIQKYSNLSAQQIKFLNCGESLQKVTRKVIMDSRDDSIRSGVRLVKTLADGGQLAEFFVLLYQYNQKLLQDADSETHFKVITDRSDECTSVLLTYCQLVNFFEGHIGSLFEGEVTSVNDLVSSYGMTIQWALELWREHTAADIPIELSDDVLELGALKKVLYIDFWRLNLYDIGFDGKWYDNELQRLKAENRGITERIRITQSSRRDESEDVMRQDAKLRAELAAKEKFNFGILETLSEDREKHEAHAARITELIEASKKDWFASGTPTDAEIESFVQYCVIPRALHSGFDAVFVASFITTVLDSEACAKVLDYLLSDGLVISLLFTLTSLEAENLGLFISEVFAFYGRDEATPEEKKKSVDAMKLIVSSLDSNILDTDEYLSRRNTFTFLKNFISAIRVDEIGETLRESAEEAARTETREDLKLATNAIVALLQSASKKWVHIWEFLDCSDDEKKKLQGEREAVLRRKMIKKREEKLQQERLAQEKVAELERERKRQEMVRLSKQLAEEKERETALAEKAKSEADEAKEEAEIAVEDAAVTDGSDKMDVDVEAARLSSSLKKEDADDIAQDADLEEDDASMRGDPTSDILKSDDSAMDVESETTPAVEETNSNGVKVEEITTGNDKSTPNADLKIEDKTDSDFKPEDGPKVKIESSESVVVATIDSEREQSLKQDVSKVGVSIKSVPDIALEELPSGPKAIKSPSVNPAVKAASYSSSTPAVVRSNIIRDIKAHSLQRILRKTADRPDIVAILQRDDCSAESMKTGLSKYFEWCCGGHEPEGRQFEQVLGNALLTSNWDAAVNAARAGTSAKTGTTSVKSRAPLPAQEAIVRSRAPLPAQDTLVRQGETHAAPAPRMPHIPERGGRFSDRVGGRRSDMGFESRLERGPDRRGDRFENRDRFQRDHGRKEYTTGVYRTSSNTSSHTESRGSASGTPTSSVPAPPPPPPPPPPPGAPSRALPAAPSHSERERRNSGSIPTKRPYGSSSQSNYKRSRR